MIVYAPADATSMMLRLYDMNLVIIKTGFICNFIEKYYTTHNPKVE